MPSINENNNMWDNDNSWISYSNGDVWSDPWGGTPYLWYTTILPRILRYLPAKTILEISPGHGRCTQFLKDLCEKLIIVDLSQTCIDYCKNRFINSSNIEYHVNDGKSLNFVKDSSVDFVFTWDSLVHVESDCLESYILECDRILKPNGIGFIHHSNFTETSDIKNYGWRATSVNAEIIKQFIDNTGLKLIAQETIDWASNQEVPIRCDDCISMFVKTDLNIKSKFIKNDFFREYVKQVKDISSSYNY